MNKNLVITSFVLLFILTVSLVSNSSTQTALAQDLSSLKDEATKLLTGFDNGQRTNNDSASTANNSTASSDSSLREKATGALGGLLN
jgi:predicted PurR-regulated permease PerM